MPAVTKFALNRFGNVARAKLRCSPRSGASRKGQERVIRIDKRHALGNMSVVTKIQNPAFDLEIRP